MKCSHPIVVGGRVLPCGKCIMCRKGKVNEWAYRLCLEKSIWKDASFVTLTYNEENLPENGLLVKSDLQKFFKRLRKHIDVRYFACGEYGSQFSRPHYHAIIFGLSYKNVELVEKTWKKGFVKVLPFQEKSAFYVAKYCTKSFQQEKEGVREFVIMSKRLALSYYKTNLETILRDGYIKYKDRKIPLCPYFKKKLKELGLKIKPKISTLYHVYYTGGKKLDLEYFDTNKNCKEKYIDYSTFYNNVLEKNVQRERNYVAKSKRKFDNYYKKEVLNPDIFRQCNYYKQLKIIDKTKFYTPVSSQKFYLKGSDLYNFRKYDKYIKKEFPGSRFFLCNYVEYSGEIEVVSIEKEYEYFGGLYPMFGLVSDFEREFRLTCILFSGKIINYNHCKYRFNRLRQREDGSFYYVHATDTTDFNYLCYRLSIIQRRLYRCQFFEM